MHPCNQLPSSALKSSTVSSQQGSDPLFDLFLCCNPSAIPLVFKDTILTSSTPTPPTPPLNSLPTHPTPQKSRRIQGIRLQPTRQLSCSGTLRSKGFHFLSLSAAKPSLPAGQIVPPVAHFLQRGSSSEQRPDCAGNLWLEFGARPPTNPAMHKSSTFHHRRQDGWLQASLIILK